MSQQYWNATTTLCRRAFLQEYGLGFGSLALACLLNDQSLLGGPTSQTAGPPFSNLRPRRGHFPGTAKNVIQLLQPGGPSQMDLFDPKPELTKRHGQIHSQDVEKLFANKENILMGSPFEFRPRGACGMELSELIPCLSEIADDLTLIRSLHTDHNNHPEGLTMLLTGKIFPGRPVLGSWISYALGSENQNLPSYVVLRPNDETTLKSLWSSGWLPALFQGTEFKASATPVHYLSPARPISPGVRREDLDLLTKMNREHQRGHAQESELEARIQNYELAARMQLAATQVLDLSKESESTKKLYGLDNPITADYGTRCLMARRMIQAGVRFVQVHPPGADRPGNLVWDHHNQLKRKMPKLCAQTDLPSAALIRDLKNQGLLEHTIVIWGGEFGRLPVSQGALSPRSGRDHNRHAFSLWVAGGGFKNGLVYGETDEFGYKSVVDRVSVADLHATLLHSLGLDHKRLNYSHRGIEESLTDARLSGAKVIGKLLKNPPQG